MVQPLLAHGAIVTVIRCSVGAPSECRDASASLTCGTMRSLYGRNPNGESNRFRVPEIEGSPWGSQVVTTEKCYVYTDY